MKEIIKNIWMWTWFSQEKGYNFNGFIVSDGHDKVIIDPVPMEPAVYEELKTMGPFKAVYLTNKDHERMCWTIRRDLGVPVWIHKQDKSFLKEKPDEVYHEGSRLACGIEVLHFPDQKSPGESGFYIYDRKILILGDALIGDPPGKLRLLPDAKYKDPGRAKAGLTRLRSLEVEVLLLGDGDPLLTHPYKHLEQFFLVCDKYPGETPAGSQT